MVIILLHFWSWCMLVASVRRRGIIMPCLLPNKSWYLPEVLPTHHTIREGAIIFKVPFPLNSFQEICGHLCKNKRVIFSNKRHTELWHHTAASGLPDKREREIACSQWRLARLEIIFIGSCSSFRDHLSRISIRVVKRIDPEDLTGVLSKQSCGNVHKWRNREERSLSSNVRSDIFLNK